MKKLYLLMVGAWALALFPASAFAEGEWAKTASDHRALDNQTIEYNCPQVAMLPDHSVWGSNIYTDDSSVCLAAVHAGLITAAGGIVYIQHQPGKSSYESAVRNGITSKAYGSYPGSFIFVTAAGSPIGLAHGGHDAAMKLAIKEVQGYPNTRASNDPPANAIDGDIKTFTWTTEAWNMASESYLAIAFESAMVGSLSLWKTNEGGGGEPVKDLTIYYTTETGPLESRTWLPVSGLVSGFMGAEIFHATSVNPEGTVIGDVHNSASEDGWGSLSFTPITATGLRIGFKNQHEYSGCGGGAPISGCNHYRVAEFEAYGAAPVAPVEPGAPEEPVAPAPPVTPAPPVAPAPGSY